jgi:hypothetical protein
MPQGETLYQALEASHPLVSRLPIAGPGCFETFPHAITRHLRSGQARAAQKRTQRQELLRQARIALAPLTSNDLIDAALCALTAHHAASGGDCVVHGEPDTGLGVQDLAREKLTPLLPPKPQLRRRCRGRTGTTSRHRPALFRAPLVSL